MDVIPIAKPNVFIRKLGRRRLSSARRSSVASAAKKISLWEEQEIEEKIALDNARWHLNVSNLKIEIKE